MKTLFITSLYANLNKTDLGGRASRELHYRWSLLNILNLQPSKVICFTSAEELEGLESWFYETQSVDKELLEFRVYDLYSCDHYDLIQQNKDVNKVKAGDRCHEIQYMKFFWSRLIEDRHDYDRLYWIDAGLSHGGIFPEEYMMGDKWERHFLINLFKPEVLNGWNDITDNKVVLISKNNTDRYFWSQTIPENYYHSYNRDRHIVGGMFGGTPSNYDSLTDSFEFYLLKLLKEQDELYHEELIMTCMYNNAKSKFTPLEFDDWYYRPEWKDEYEADPKLFYHIFK